MRNRLPPLSLLSASLIISTGHAVDMHQWVRLSVMADNSVQVTLLAGQSSLIEFLLGDTGGSPAETHFPPANLACWCLLVHHIQIVMPLLPTRPDLT